MIIDKLASKLGLKPAFIELVAHTASYRYKTYAIPKKTGGSRIIDHPARELKVLQGWLTENVFSRFPIHKSATAYKKGSSVLINAQPHRKKKYLLKVDFEDFFHSITSSDVVQLLTRNSALTKNTISGANDVDLVTRIVCRKGRLTIGAPSSPIISNLVMFEFDKKRALYCRGRQIVYTRYADDLYFSTDERGALDQLLADLREDIAHRYSPRLRINERKTVFASRKRRRLVTGLILTPTGQISLGRNRKRFIRSLVFKSTQHALAPNELLSLAGLLAYARSVEPVFIDSLRTKYGAKAVFEA
jgi:RNA-directed DNA polymerase